MSRHTLCILDAEPESYGEAVEMGRSGGEILVDCPYRRARCPLDCRVYRKDRVVGGKSRRRHDRASGSRREAVEVEHRFLGEEGT